MSSNDATVISVRGLHKNFGKQVVLDGIDFDLTAGKIYAISGANGSGKSVLMRTLCGLVRPTAGKVMVFGAQIGAEVEFPRSTGVLVDNPGFLLADSGWRNLDLLARISGKASKVRIEEVMRFVGLDPLDRRPVGAYSTGMRQRLGLAQAVMEAPELLLLDEPTNGLDYEGQKEIYTYLVELRRQGKTILFTSHSQDEIKVLCDQIWLLENGKLTLQQAEVPE